MTSNATDFFIVPGLGCSESHRPLAQGDKGGNATRGHTHLPLRSGAQGVPRFMRRSRNMD